MPFLAMISAKFYNKDPVKLLNAKLVRSILIGGIVLLLGDARETSKLSLLLSLIFDPVWGACVSLVRSPFAKKLSIPLRRQLFSHQQRLFSSRLVL